MPKVYLKDRGQSSRRDILSFWKAEESFGIIPNGIGENPNGEIPEITGFL
jgi:hypothetical protein